MPILDCHTHAFPDNIAPGAMKTLLEEVIWHSITCFHDGTVGGLLASMDRAGVAAAVVCSVATRPSQVRKITDWSAAIASDRLIPFASVHPDFDQPEAEIERIAELGIKGLKVHSQYMRCDLDDPRMLRIARRAAKLNLAMLVHPGYDVSFPKDEFGSPRQLRALHEAVPELRILAAHAGGWQRWEDALELVAGQRIYMDTSFALSGHSPPELLHRILERHRPEYLVFGTDSPWLDQAAEMKEFMALPLPEPVKRAALWENGWAFLGMERNSEG